MAKKSGVKAQKTTENQSNGFQRKACPITREQFLEKAKELTINIGGVSRIAAVKEFSTGSLGFYLNDKINLEIDGVTCQFQVGLNITLVGSKDLPQS